MTIVCKDVKIIKDFLKGQQQRVNKVSLYIRTVNFFFRVEKKIRNVYLFANDRLPEEKSMNTFCRQSAGNLSLNHEY